MSTEDGIFGYEKALSKWVPRGLTFDQKQRRVDDSKQCLKMIKRNKAEFLRRYVIMDETWLHHFTLKSNRQSFEWTAYDEPAPKRGKMQLRPVLKQMTNRTTKMAFLFPLCTYDMVDVDYIPAEQLMQVSSEAAYSKKTDFNTIRSTM
ncbi:hypothetical protein GWI33_018693 [Rhynchophorus ferrugineus]|uniref:Transposase n=1 Tax=Rhynchophorus ferrugineus TaxID=354439 RepID=A0A834HT71_RHYFE|nr:hypothetical protein GWI33_018693 [Rhynchophorus ferrugineus]